MKQWKKHCLIFAAAMVMLSGCSSRKTMVSLEEAKNMTEEQLKENLSGFTQAEIQAAWGEGAGPLFGLYGEVFQLDDERTLVLYYEGDGQTVQDVAFGESSQSFEGTIRKIHGTSAVVEVDEGFPIRSSGDRVSVSLEEEAAKAQVGDRVRITYSGSVMESYPLQLGNQKSIQLLERKTDEENSGENPYPQVLTEPPVLQLQDVLSSTYGEFEVRSGNYTWYCQTENEDEMTCIAACGAGPLEEAEKKERLKLPQYNKLDCVSYMVSWEVMPDSITVKVYDTADLGNADAKTLSDARYEEIFTIGLKPERIYEITAEWKEEQLDKNGFYGNASYVIVTE